MKELVADIKKRISLQGFLEKHYQLKFKGKQCLCPFHQDSNASLTVYEDKTFFCFGCGEKGDIISFVSKIENLDFKATLEKLAAEVGIKTSFSGTSKSSIQNLLLFAVDFYNQNLLKSENQNFLQTFIMETGLSSETISRFKIGLAGGSNLLIEQLRNTKISLKDAIASGLVVRTKEGIVDYFSFRTIFPLWREGKPWFLTARRIHGVTPDKHYEQGKYKHLRTNEYIALDQFVNEEIVESQNDLIITEGITDTCMALQKGLPAIGVLGVAAFKQDWKKRLLGKNVYICFDNDEPGREGSKRIQSLLKGSKIIHLPEEGMDLSDFFNKGRSIEEFNALLKNAEPDEKPIELSHLLDIEDPKYDSKLVSVQIIIVGMNSNAFHATKRYRATCNHYYDCKVEACPLKMNEGTEVFTLDQDSREFINSCQATDLMIIGMLRAKTCVIQRKIRIEIQEKVTLQELFAIPKVVRFRPMEDPDTKEIKLMDENRREYKEKKLFFIGFNAATSTYYNAIGYVKTHPRTQAITLLINKLVPLNDDFQEFQLTEKAKEEMRVVQKMVTNELSFPYPESFDSLSEYFKDITLNVTKVFERDPVLFGMLLVYHSCLSLYFNKEYIHRGYLELVVVGDSGQAKTHMFNKLADFVGVGDLVSGLSSSRTGISYSLVQDTNGWSIKWGLLPLNSRKLLGIDEAGVIDKLDLRQMSQGRSEGVIKVDRIANGEAECRTRTIFLANPRDNRIIDEWMYGCESLRDLFEAPDIRRFDFAIFLSASDIKKDLINRLFEGIEKKEQKITCDVIRTSVFWAWTRKPHQIIIDSNVTQDILDASNHLADKYGAAINTPLCNSADLRLKIARLSTAYAALRCSTDETFENIVVTEGCVKTIVAFLEKIYSHQNCSLDKYADVQKQLNILSEEEYQEIKAKILAQIENEEEKERHTTKELIKTFMVHNRIKGVDLSEQIDVSKDYLSEKIRFLRRYNLLDSDNRGYFKKPKFVKFLRRVLEDSDFAW